MRLHIHLQKRYIKRVSIVIFPITRREIQLREFEGMPKETRTRFLTNIVREENIDDFTFDLWKAELEKELPSFWESISKLQKEDH